MIDVMVFLDILFFCVYLLKWMLLIVVLVLVMWVINIIIVIKNSVNVVLWVECIIYFW